MADPRLDAAAAIMQRIYEGGIPKRYAGDWPREQARRILAVVDDVVVLPDRVPDQRPGIIGRDRALVDKVAKLVHNVTKKEHEWTPLREDRRGSWFEVRVTGPEGPTKHIVRVTIELDRLEELDNARS